MKAPFVLRPLSVVLGFHMISGAMTLNAQTAATMAAAPVAEIQLSTQVFDALAAIENSSAGTYGLPEVQRLVHAVWWDANYSEAEINLAERLHAAERPIVIRCSDERTLSFTKRTAPDAGALARAMLPARLNLNASTYFIEAFRRTRDAGVFVGACHLNELAVKVMDTLLEQMVTEARFAAKTAGEKPLLDLFQALETSYREANPNLQAEFADAVRRVVAKFAANRAALPEAVWNAAWLQASK